MANNSGRMLDFETDNGVELVTTAWNLSATVQQPRNDQAMDDYEMYRSFIDTSDRDSTRAHVAIPKVLEKVEIKSPRQVKALLGSSPAIPFEAKRDDFKAAGKVQSEILDGYLERADLYMKTMFVDKLATLSGTAYIEPTPITEDQKFAFLQPQSIGGVQIGIERVEKMISVFGLKLTPYALHQVMVDPYGVGLEKKGDSKYAIIQQLTHKSDILKIRDQGGYPQISEEQWAKFESSPSGGFNSSSSGGVNDVFGPQMLERLGLPKPADGSHDVGVLLRFQSEGRYIDVWNGTFLLRDIPNPYDHGLINLVRMIHNFDPQIDNQFFGLGEAQVLAVLQSLLNDLTSMTINVHNTISQPVFAFDPAMVEFDDIVWEYANRIKIKNLDGRPIDTALKIMDTPQLPAEHYLLADRIERYMDTIASGVGPQQRSEQGAGTTATEQAILKEAGDERLELNIRAREQIYLKGLGNKCNSHIEQFAKDFDLIQMVGEEKFLTLQGMGLSSNPASLPGGYNYTFRGSNSVTNHLVERRNDTELYSQLISNPTTRADEAARMLMEAYDKDEDQIDRMVIPLEVLMQLQAQQAEQEAQQQESQGGGGQSKDNSTQKTAQDSARTNRGQSRSVA